MLKRSIGHRFVLSTLFAGSEEDLWKSACFSHLTVNFFAFLIMGRSLGGIKGAIFYRYIRESFINMQNHISFIIRWWEFRSYEHDLESMSLTRMTKSLAKLTVKNERISRSPSWDNFESSKPRKMRDATSSLWSSWKTSENRQHAKRDAVTWQEYLN